MENTNVENMEVDEVGPTEIDSLKEVVYNQQNRITNLEKKIKAAKQSERIHAVIVLIDMVHEVIKDYFRLPM